MRQGDERLHDPPRLLVVPAVAVRPGRSGPRLDAVGNGSRQGRHEVLRHLGHDPTAAKAAAWLTTKSLFINTKDCMAVVVDSRRSQFTVITGASKVDSSDTGFVRTTCRCNAPSPSLRRGPPDRPILGHRHRRPTGSIEASADQQNLVRRIASASAAGAGSGYRGGSPNRRRRPMECRGLPGDKRSTS